MKHKVLPRSFYLQDTRKVAQELLGKLLVRKVNDTRLSGIIVETEAYRGFDDTACHAHKGPTERCKVMFGEGGFAYVYFTYGMYNMLNLVTEKKFFPAAVLIRAIDPVEGIDVMFERRGVKKDMDLTSGPGKLTQALSIDRKLNGADLTSGENIWAEEPNGQMVEWLNGRHFKVGRSPRIGIDYADETAKNWEWRYFVGGNKFVSR
jgi:DNA-3-methyladenine glycosylase